MTTTPIVGGRRKRLEPYALSEDDPWGSQRSKFSVSGLTDIFYKVDILINKTYYACLTDFSLLTIASDATGVTCSNSFLEDGTYRWTI